jgi:hypothetical protein
MRLLVRPATALALLAAVAISPPAAQAASIDPPDPGQPPYVVITALDGKPDTTTSLVVQLHLNWPAGAEQVLVTNGDGLVTTLTLNAPVVDWQLLPLAADTAADTRTVTVTYRGPAIADATVADDIVLDSQPPRLPLQRLYANGKGWFLALKAQDRGTGVQGIALLGSSGQPITGTVVCSSSACPADAFKTFFTASARPRLVRVTDAAGSSKALTLVRRETTCHRDRGSYPVFRGLRGSYDCFAEGARCSKSDSHYWRESAYARCRQGRVQIIGA